MPGKNITARLPQLETASRRFSGPYAPLRDINTTVSTCLGWVAWIKRCLFTLIARPPS